MTYSQYDLKKLQRVQLHILLELKRICDKHGIHYFLLGGTLIGAIRHHGFIPWDDDIDVGMLRSDYVKFISVCQDELSAEYFLQTKESDEFCSLPWAKLMLNGTKMLDESVSETQTHAGIYIDIFPYDNVPQSSLRLCIHSNLCWMLRGIYGVKCGYRVLNRDRSLKKRLGMVFCNLVAPFLSKKSVSAMIDAHFQKYNRKDTEYVMNLSSSYSYQRERIERTVVSTYVQVPFEEEMFPVPRDYHHYLTNVFGNYMQFPPEEQRVQHATLELDFGKYGEL